MQPQPPSISNSTFLKQLISHGRFIVLLLCVWGVEKLYICYDLMEQKTPRATHQQIEEQHNVLVLWNYKSLV